jgi:hypothetical protein
VQAIWVRLKRVHLAQRLGSYKRAIFLVGELPSLDVLEGIAIRLEDCLCRIIEVHARAEKESKAIAKAR